MSAARKPANDVQGHATELVAADLDALAALIGWDAVSRLRVGDVAAVGFQHLPGDAATGDGAGAAAANDPPSAGRPMIYTPDGIPAGWHITFADDGAPILARDVRSVDVGRAGSP